MSASKRNRASKKNENGRTFSIHDSQTNKIHKITVPNSSTTIDMKQLQQAIPLRVFDPGFTNTAIAKSSICFIDGHAGHLLYRGYSISELSTKSTFLETAFLVIHGALPSREQHAVWQRQILRHTFLHTNLLELLGTFRYDAHPMPMFIAALHSLSTFYPDANPCLQGADVYKRGGAQLVNKTIYRILGKLPSIAACAYRHRIGRAYNAPTNHLSYAANFLYMLQRLNDAPSGAPYEPDARLAKALDVLFILHCEHEMNCSTAAVRHVASAAADPITAVAAGASALYGPLHGGANESVLRMLQHIGSVSNIEPYLAEVRSGSKRLVGFGHRVYRSYDPRARIVRNIARQVFAITQTKSPLVEVALALEERALADEYFVKRKLYPNVDFWTGLIYSSMGFPTDFFPVLFAIGRAPGWIAHWLEQLHDSDVRIYRPRQEYVGESERPFVAMEHRGDGEKPDIDLKALSSSKL